MLQNGNVQRKNLALRCDVILKISIFAENNFK